MKVFLIQPHTNNLIIDETWLLEPLALEYLGVGLKMDGHEVMLHDARLDPDIQTDFVDFQPDIVGITGYTIHRNIIKDIAAQLKQLQPELFVVVGGHHATICPTDFNDPHIDLVVIGEGVQALRSVTQRLRENKPIDDIEGLAFPGKSMTFTSPRTHPPLNELPFPDRTLTQQHRQNYYVELMRPTASVRTSLSCSSRCTFCSIWKTTDGKYLRRSPEEVVEELKTVAEPHIYLSDDESMLDVKRMDRLADLIREAGIQKKFTCYARVDTVIKHPDLIEKWRDIGLTRVYIGFESFDNKRLQKLKKNITTDQQEQAVKIINKLGLFCFAQFMIEPDFDRSDFDALIRYVRNLKLRYASFSVLTPLPGTQLYQEKEKDLITQDPLLYDFLHTVLPTKLPMREFYQELARTYEQAVPFYLSVYNYYKAAGLYPTLVGLVKVMLYGRNDKFIDRLRDAYLDHERAMG